MQFTLNESGTEIREEIIERRVAAGIRNGH